MNSPEAIATERCNAITKADMVNQATNSNELFPCLNGGKACDLLKMEPSEYCSSCRAHHLAGELSRVIRYAVNELSHIEVIG